MTEPRGRAGILLRPLLDWRLVLALILAAGGCWLVVDLALAVTGGRQPGFDRAIIMGLRRAGDPNDPLGPGWLQTALRDLTALGGLTVAPIIGVVVAGGLFLCGRRAQALLVVIVGGGAIILFNIVKEIVQRPRPDLVPHAVPVGNYSFPSGHSTLSAALYLTLAVLLAGAQRRSGLRLYTLVVGVLVVAVIGFSRVYLGVHWPSDVLAGWTLGATWALFCWAVAIYLGRRARLLAAPIISPAMVGPTTSGAEERRVEVAGVGGDGGGETDGGRQEATDVEPGEPGPVAAGLGRGRTSAASEEEAAQHRGEQP